MPLACACPADMADRRSLDAAPPAPRLPFACRAETIAGRSARGRRRAARQPGAAPWRQADALLRAAAVLLLSAAAVAAAPSAADLGDGAPVALAGLAASVADWTAEASGLPRPTVLPVVARASRQEMAALHYGAGAGAAGLAEIAALYDRRRGRILLAEDWAGATPREVSVLVHEFVHHFEAAAGLAPDCPAAGEVRAYATQAAWLAGFGSDLQQGFGIDPLTLRLLTTCPRLRR